MANKTDINEYALYVNNLDNSNAKIIYWLSLTNLKHSGTLCKLLDSDIDINNKMIGIDIIDLSETLNDFQKNKVLSIICNALTRTPLDISNSFELLYAVANTAHYLEL